MVERRKGKRECIVFIVCRIKMGVLLKITSSSFGRNYLNKHICFHGSNKICFSFFHGLLLFLPFYVQDKICYKNRCLLSFPVCGTIFFLHVFSYSLMVHFQSLGASFLGPFHGLACSLPACRRKDAGSF